MNIVVSLTVGYFNQMSN